MKVLYVITKANWGGAQKYVFELASAAKAAGHDVAVAYGEPGKLAQVLEASGIRTRQIAGLGRDVSLGEVSALVVLVRAIREESPHVLHVNSSKAGALGCLAGRLAGVPRIVFTAHGWGFNETRPWWQKALIFTASGITVWLSQTTICVSEAVARDIRRMPGVSGKLVVVRNGILCPTLLPREDARAKLSPPSIGKYWIGMVSELHPTKRVNDVIEAMRTVVAEHPEAQLVVIGEGEERERLRDLIRDLKLRDHVYLAGFVPEAATLLKAFDLFIQASVSEAMVFAVLEAACASLPVIATRVGGIPEIIPDNDHGILVPAKDPAAIAAGVLALMKDGHRAHELGARLHARVAAHFSREEMLSKTLALY